MSYGLNQSIGIVSTAASTTGMNVMSLHIRFCSGFAASTTMATVSGIANFYGKRSTRSAGIDSTAIRTTGLNQPNAKKKDTAAIHT